jgi:hypothetical protein
MGYVALMFHRIVPRTFVGRIGFVRVTKEGVMSMFALPSWCLFFSSTNNGLPAGLSS